MAILRRVLFVATESKNQSWVCLGSDLANLEDGFPPTHFAELLSFPLQKSLELVLWPILKHCLLISLHQLRLLI